MPNNNTPLPQPLSGYIFDDSKGEKQHAASKIYFAQDGDKLTSAPMINDTSEATDVEAKVVNIDRYNNTGGSKGIFVSGLSACVGLFLVETNNNEISRISGVHLPGGINEEHVERVKPSLLRGFTGTSANRYLVLNYGSNYNEESRDLSPDKLESTKKHIAKHLSVDKENIVVHYGKTSAAIDFSGNYGQFLYEPYNHNHQGEYTVNQNLRTEEAIMDASLEQLKKNLPKEANITELDNLKSDFGKIKDKNLRLDCYKQANEFLQEFTATKPNEAEKVVNRHLAKINDMQPGLFNTICKFVKCIFTLFSTSKAYDASFADYKRFKNIHETNNQLADKFSTFFSKHRAGSQLEDASPTHEEEIISRPS